MKLKQDKNGYVEILMRTGKDLVASKVSILIANAIISNGKKVEESSEFEGYNLSVDDQYFLASIRKKPEKPEFSEPTTKKEE
jgi:hypothetical protein